LILFDKQIIVLSKDAKFLKIISLDDLLIDNPKGIKVKAAMFDNQDEPEIKITGEDGQAYLLLLKLGNLNSIKVESLAPILEFEVSNDLEDLKELIESPVRQI